MSCIPGQIDLTGKVVGWYTNVWAPVMIEIATKANIHGMLFKDNRGEWLSATASGLQLLIHPCHC